MTDVYHYWSGDFQIGATGDLLVTDPTTAGKQTVLRRLLTNPLLTDSAGTPLASPDYTWHADYGAGLPRQVGSPANIPAVIAQIQAQLQLEDVVSPTPEPQINAVAIDNGISVTIRYNDANTMQPVTLSFDVNR